MSEAIWSIRHGDHEAWLQRALLPGEFKPGLAPSARFVVDAEGRAVDPGTELRCAGCGGVPQMEELEPVEIATGRSGFLRRFREGPRPGLPPDPWPELKLGNVCYWCNGPGGSGEPPLCPCCREYLRRGL